MPYFSDKSLSKLYTCHPDLQDLFNEVIQHRDCSILDGHRNEEDQNHAFANGFSNAKWPLSEHNSLPSMAVDVMPYYSEKPHIRWDDVEGITELGNFVEGVAAAKGTSIRWGGRFKSFFDGPHYELK